MNIKTNGAAGGEPVPDWKLERYLLGELPRRELEEIGRLEASDGGLRGRIDALRADNAALLAQYPPDAAARRIAAAAGAGNDVSAPRARQARAGGAGVAGRRDGVRGIPSFSRNRPGLARWAIPALACAALLVALPARIIPRTEPDDRVKGVTPRLEVWRKAGVNAERLAPEAVALPGDIVQLRYVVPKFCYGALVSVDGRGVLTVHLSGDSGKAAPLTPGRPVALDNSYQLDDAPRFETFYLITASHAFNIDDVPLTLTLPLKLPLKLPRGQQITEFTLLKGGHKP